MAEHLPTRTCIGVTALAAGARVEVDLVAYRDRPIAVPAGHAARPAAAHSPDGLSGRASGPSGG
jgi:hypothetical protein